MDAMSARLLGDLRRLRDLSTSRLARLAGRQSDADRHRRDWRRIEVNQAEGEADVYIYDSIGFFGTSAAEFVDEINALDVARMNVHINSPGGEVWDGMAIHTSLVNHSAEVHVFVDSLAASIAAVIAMAGDRVTMARNSMMMIHDPWSIVIGDAELMRKEAEVLDLVAESTAGFFRDRAGGDLEDWRAAMREETWYSDREAVEAGLADEVAGDATEPADRFDLSIFQHTPKRLLKPEQRNGHDPDELGLAAEIGAFSAAIRSAIPAAAGR